jgi:hypothetical protein
VLVIPSDAERHNDLDAHFFNEKGTVPACILLANLIAYGSRYALMGWASFAYFSRAGWGELSFFICACAAGIFIKERKAMIAILTIMILLSLSDPVETGHSDIPRTADPIP